MRASKLKWPIFGGVLIAAVLASAVRVFWFGPSGHDRSGRTILRLSHYMLAPTTKAAIDDVVAEYERRHPDVHVVVMPIPERVYLAFLNAHLNADTAPDIIELGHQFTGWEELRTRYFTPITRLVEEPNPYDVGTPSEGERWRDTFIEGLNSIQAYSTTEHQYYGVPMALATLRVFYNRALLREITGGDMMPEDYPGFVALCEQVEEFARKTGRAVSPIAGSRYDGLFLMSQYFSNVNQRLYFELDSNHSLAMTWWDYPKAYLQGRWNFDTPSIRAGFALMRETGSHMRTGFLELPSSEASFQFLQQQALMTTALTTDSVVLRDNASFPVGVAALPQVQPNDPRYGHFVLGPLSEANLGATMTFSVVQRSAHRQLALDLLRFLGSHPASEIFSRRTGWIPMIASVPTSAPAKPLQPVMNGYSGRFLAEMNGMGDGRYVAIRNLHLLFAQDGGVDAFCADLKQHYEPAMIIDLNKEVANGIQNLRRQEPVALGTYARTPADPVETDRIVSGQNYSETRTLQTRELLGRHGRNDSARISR